MQRKSIKKILIVLIIQMLLLVIPNKNFANYVEYKGGAEGLITAPDDFFLEFGELLPGDSKEDLAYIKNSTDDDIEVFFKTEPLEKEEYYDDVDYSLLEKISLRISLKQTSSSEEELLYEGNLGAETMSEYISLGTYQKGYDGEFIFKIEVPTSLKNAYTLSATKVKWVFAVEKKEKQEEQEKPNESTEVNNNTINKPNNGYHESTKDKNNVIDKVTETITGDRIYYAVAILGIAIVVLVIVILKKRKDDKNE